MHRLSAAVLLWFWLLASSATQTNAQVTGAVIHGIVNDAQEAPIPNAELKVTHGETGVSYTTRSNASGLYEFPLLNPGNYTLTAKVAGFAAYTHRELRLVLQQRLRVDFQMQVASLAESVWVSGTPTIIDTETAKVSHIISGDVVAKLPFNGRNMYMITRLVPGANPTAAAESFAMAFDTFTPSNVSFNGAPVMANSILIDGVANQYGNGAMGFSPSPEAVQEVAVQSFALSAEHGQTAGSVVSVETKSGTNTPHGTLFAYHNDVAFNANDFFGNKFARAKATQVMNQFGGNIGAPIYIPGLYKGSNRTFFFYNYERNRRRFGRRSLNTTPTALERTGDFSETRTTDGRLIQIYNPFTTQFDPANPTVLIRDPFPGNRIPASMFSPIGQRLLEFVPLPNLPGPVNNQLHTFGSINNSNSNHVRIDHRLSEKNTLNGSFGYNKRVESNPTTYPTGVTGWLMPDSKTLWTLGDTHVFSPTTILNIRSGISLARNDMDPRTTSEDVESLGFPASFKSLVRSSDFPSVSNSDMTGYGNSTARRNFYTPDIRAYITKIAGRHSVNFGYEFRLFRVNVRTTNGEAGNFSFNRDWTQGPRAATASATAGHGVATMLLGTPSGGSVNINVDSAAQTVYHALYFQDNWRITSRLTLNLGLRYDHETPVTERFNRVTRGFDDTATSPIAQQAQTSYARNPIPELGSFQVRGGIRFAGLDGEPRFNFDPVREEFMPRIGFAFQAASKLAIRGGYGLFYIPLREVRGFGVSQSNLPMSQIGFNSTTAMQTSLNGRPLHTLSDPFPQGFVQPIGASLGLSTSLGQSLNIYDTSARRGRSHEFQMGVQHELPSQILLDVGYVGSRISFLPVDKPINDIPREYLGLGDELNRQVANPFEGLIAIGNLSRPTVAKSQLLRPYPQFTNITSGFLPIGSTWYNSLQMSANKRFTRGLTFLASYTFAKHMQETGYLNFGDPLERVISPVDRPHRFVASGLWSLPVGKGKRFGGSLPRALNYVIGDWELGGIGTITSGQPVGGWGGAIVTRSLQPIERSLDKWFDTGAFQPQPAFTLRTLSSFISQIRTDATQNVDVTLAKAFPLTEAVSLRIQAQFFNFFNTPQFGSPNTSVTNSAFGSISSQANSPRWVWVGGKLEF